MPAPTPFTMEDVVNGVLLQLRYAPGRDVQIHLQDSIAQDASILYRSLMTRFIWRDFINLSTVTALAADGTPTVAIATLTKFSDIAAVYSKTHQQSQPLPFAYTLENPSRFRHPTVVPAPQPKVFAIYPTGKTADYYVWSRVMRDTDFGLDDTIPFYKDMLVLGTAYKLCIKSGVNAELSQQLKSEFDAQVAMYRSDEVKPQYNTRSTSVPNPMTDWWAA